MTVNARPRRLRLILAVALTALMGASGCTETPTERLTATWEAAEQERFDVFVSHFTAESVPVVRGLVDTASRTKKAFAYVDSPYALVPQGEILEVEERGELIEVLLASPTVIVQAPTPTGQVTPVPPRPQYPSGFLARYCW